MSIAYAPDPGEGFSYFLESAVGLAGRLRTAARFILGHSIESPDTSLGRSSYPMAEKIIGVGGIAATMAREEIPPEDPDEVARRDGVNRKDTVQPRGTERFGSAADDPDTGSNSRGRTRGRGRNPQEH